MTTGTPPPPRAPRRSRLRTFLPLGLAAWLVLEVWLLTVVAGAWGGFTVFLLLLAGSLLGGAVMKRAGRRAFQALNEAVRQQQAHGTGALPADGRRGKGNGFLMLAGALLMLPGLISDVAGLLCLLPPVQRFLKRTTERSLERKVRTLGGPGAHGGFADAFQQARMHRPDGKVVQGEVIREEDRRPDRDEGGDRPPLTR
ncbi:FxsA family membrane protein [Streptomyces sp. NPDC060194]|uniref:FxsA family membrane protein n=1 Tax=Streptomyces sp. NPDC060194 TaxID=3347069 RepID=UPI00364BC350